MGEAIKQANKSVQGYIDTVKDKAQVFTKMYNTLKSLGDKALKGIKNFKLGDKAEPQGDKNYSINYSDVSEIQCEFSDVTNTKFGLNDTKSVIERK